MTVSVLEFLGQYQVAASLRAQVFSSLTTYNSDMLSLVLSLEESKGPGGSHPGRSPNLIRNAEEGNVRLMTDYFGPTPVYGEGHFRRRFRMSRRLFVRIVEALGEHDVYFTQRIDAVGKVGISPYQKCTAAIRQLAYGTSADQQDEYLRIGESTAIDCLLCFCSGIIQLFSAHYQRKPNADDISKITAENAARGFPGMLGSLDCMHLTCSEHVVLKSAPSSIEKRLSLIIKVLDRTTLMIEHLLVEIIIKDLGIIIRISLDG